MSSKVLLIKMDKPAGGPQRLSFSEPISLCYLSATLKQDDYDVHIMHIIENNAHDAILSEIRRLNPDVIGFSVRNFNFDTSCDYIREIKHQYSDIRVAIGGECITPLNAVNLLVQSTADAAFISDSERSFPAWLTNHDLNIVPGLIFRGPEGKIQVSSVGPERVDPSELPMMDRMGLPMDRYSAEAFPSSRYATMHTQRGCRYRCTFCHTALRYNKPLSRSVEQILEEIDYLTTQMDIEAIAIWDEDFFADPSRVENIAQGLIDRGSPVQWHSFMKLTDLKSRRIHRLLPQLRQSGYIRAVIGLESFIPKTLRQFHKAGGPDIEESLQLLTRNNIILCPSYIIGEPHETESDIKYGLSHLLRLKDRGIETDLPYVSFLTPFPGTLLYDRYLKEGMIIDKQWRHYDGEYVIIKSLCPPDRLIELRNQFYRDFYGDI